MNTELIGQSWDKLADKQEALVHTLYERLFEQHPDYKSLFPETMSRQMEKLVRTVALVARVDAPEIVHSRLLKLGHKHRKFNLKQEDFLNFKRVFMEVLGEYCNEYCPDVWNEACMQAWQDIFDQQIIPYMTQGLEQTMTHSEKVRIINMQTGAGNQLLGTVVSIKQDTLFAEVILELKGGDQIVGLIPPQGVSSLKLAEGSQAYAIIRISDVMLTHADTDLQFSTRNHFCGRVIQTEIGAINAKVRLLLKSGIVFQAIVGQDTLVELGIEEGERVCVVFRAIDVILAVEKEIEGL
jgi:molybdopterin-binding protein